MDGLPAYSTLEVAKHAIADDVWLIIGGKVLDVTSWLHDHPGGDVVLLDVAGRDATREFEDVGHSGDARARLDSLVIGTVRPATDAELKISRGGGRGRKSLQGKGAVGGTGEMAVAWLNEHAATWRGVGVVGIAGVAVVGLAVAMQRYVYGGRR